MIGHVSVGGAVRALTPAQGAAYLDARGLLLAVWCSPALAHARLLRESPASGASLVEPPNKCGFGSASRWTQSSIRSGCSTPRASALTRTMRVWIEDARVLLAGLEDLLTPTGWSGVTSVDGHVVEDAYAFNVTPKPARPMEARVGRRTLDSRRHTGRGSQNGWDHRRQAGWIKRWFTVLLPSGFSASSRWR